MRRMTLEKYYIVPNDCKIGEQYLEHLEFVDKVTNLFREFAKQNNIHTHTYYPNVERLWIDPNAEDIKNFSNGFMADTPGKFKLRNPLNKKWVELCNKNGLTKNVLKPYIPFYFTFGCFKCRWRLFDVDNIIYCTFQTDDTDFKSPVYLTEIKASEFYSIMESKGITIN